MIFTLVQLSACTKTEKEETSVTSIRETENTEITEAKRTDLLGTVITLSTYDDIAPELFDETFSLVETIDAKMSVNIENSEISQVNNNSGIAPTVVSPEVRDLVSWASDFSRVSNGAFDVTIGSVMELWKVDGTFEVLPVDAEIQKNLPLVNNDEITFYDDSILLNKPGMRLDLGGIAKGYACDMSLTYMKMKGVHSALLNFGGNVYAYGTKPDGSPWRIGIQTPYIKKDTIACSIDVSNTAVVTSGGYKRYFEKDNVTYHHILDPNTGYPAESGLLSVTIIDPSSTRADALSTACFVMGLEQGYRFLEAMPESDGIFITTNNQVYFTKGLLGKVTLIDSEFSLAEFEPLAQ